MKPDEFGETIKQFVTQFDSLNLGSTVEAALTKQGSQALGTVQVFATKQGSVLMATAEALATEQGSLMLATVRTFVTTEGSEFLSTAEAYATKQDMDATVRAYLTQAEGFFSGDAPFDVPLLDGGTDYYKSSGIISYSISMELSQVVEYYQKQMVIQGWQAVKAGSFESDIAAILNFEKADRQASIMLSRNPTGGTAVTIVLTTKK